MSRPTIFRATDPNRVVSAAVSEQAAASNPRWRPVGLGVMGLQDVFFALRLPFDSAEARELSTAIAEEIYLTALEASAGLAEQHGPHPTFGQTRAAAGVLQHDLWGVPGTQTKRWRARQLFRTAWELPQRALIDLAAARAAFIDQSQSLNLFLAAPSIGKMSSMYLHAWRSGLKTTYYLRSRPATRIQQTTVVDHVLVDEAAVACSLENPESCEACQ